MPEEGSHLHGRVRTQAHECGVNRRFGFSFRHAIQRESIAAFLAVLQSASRMLRVSRNLDGTRPVYPRRSMALAIYGGVRWQTFES